MSVPDLARALGLEPHPEGGWYRETWASPTFVTLPDGRVRPTATLIHFFLAAGESSAWHRVSSEEIWITEGVGSVLLALGGAESAPAVAETVSVGLGLSAGEQPQAVVPAGVWQRTLPGPADALVACLVSPGFDFADFELF